MLSDPPVLEEDVGAKGSVSGPTRHMHPADMSQRRPKEHTFISNTSSSKTLQHFGVVSFLSFSPVPFFFF